MDQRLIAHAPVIGFALQGGEHLGIDANGDELSGHAPQRRPPDTVHGPELLVGRLGKVGKVNPSRPCTSPVLCGSAGAP